MVTVQLLLGTGSVLWHGAQYQRTEGYIGTNEQHFLTRVQPLWCAALVELMLFHLHVHIRIDVISLGLVLFHLGLMLFYLELMLFLLCNMCCSCRIDVISHLFIQHNLGLA